MGFEWIVAFLVLGLVVGFMAGLLGIGGGGIMVPVLTSIFLAQGVPVEQVVHMALGTSMASIVFTSFASMRAHHKRCSDVECREVYGWWCRYRYLCRNFSSNIHEIRSTCYFLCCFYGVCFHSNGNR